MILVNKNTRVLVQGITGREGSFHTKAMLDYGTKILAGVTPGKGGQSVHGVPVYNSVEEALTEHPEINTSTVFVPAPYAPDAIYEAIDAGIRLIVVITEHIPLHDELRVISYARLKGAWIVGPNCPGVISPGESKVGIMPGHIFEKGVIGIVSRSGTLTYEIAHLITKAGLGQSTCIGIGGDPIVGMDFIEVLELFEKDKETKAVVVIGEIGGTMEEELAYWIKKRGYSKPVVAYIAGKTAPPGKRMGHAGAIITMGMGTASSKIKAFEEAGIAVAKTPREVIDLLLKKI
ncbi:MAG: succinate--CoA ligase subunit alpha [Thermoprotei archaeon]|nr:MAG: succinate--CoA ligase subunit alpha [Thermoprotei archaeon]